MKAILPDSATGVGFGDGGPTGVTVGVAPGAAVEAGVGVGVPVGMPGPLLPPLQPVKAMTAEVVAMQNPNGLRNNEEKYIMP